MKVTKSFFCVAAMILFIALTEVNGAVVIRQGSGASASALQGVIDQFRADLGGSNNGTGGSFLNGRREINWDNVPDSFAEPNNLPVDFFNVNSPRGVIFNAIEFETGAALNQFRVSSTLASGVPVRFGNVNPTYSTIFKTFSSQRLFTVRNAHLMEVNFVIPGTNVPATVKGFGVVFTDVDGSSGGSRSLIRVYGVDGRQLSAASAPALDNGLSFVGVSFNAGERIARVVIDIGNSPLNSTNMDGVNGVDVVAMDDFIYGEPKAAQFHDGDFDGDGFGDPAVFRPSLSTFYVLHSGTNILASLTLGLPGDIPVDGDFDGDKRADFALYRPSTNEWTINRSSDGATTSTIFGFSGDMPTPRDFDKDGKTDIAVWRPQEGNYHAIRSSNNTVLSIGWGGFGDIPVGAVSIP